LQAADQWARESEAVDAIRGLKIYRLYAFLTGTWDEVQHRLNETAEVMGSDFREF